MDISILINEYLKGKELLKTPDDSLNIVNNQIASWDFKNIPIPSAADLAACEVIVLANQAREAKLAQISALEAQITPRRIREAMLTNNYTFISGIEAQIAAIRLTIV